MDLFTDTGLCNSKSDARRLVTQNGASINDVKRTDPKGIITVEDITADSDIILKAGKKRFFRIVVI